MPPLFTLLFRFPLLKELKFSPNEVNVLDPLEVQLEQVGIIRHFSTYEDLRNMDPDFTFLERHFDMLNGPPATDAVSNHLMEIDETEPSALSASVEDSGLTAVIEDRSLSEEESDCAPVNNHRCVSFFTEVPASHPFPNLGRENEGKPVLVDARGTNQTSE